MQKSYLLIATVFLAGLGVGRLSAPAAPAPKVVGIGGVFFKSKDPAALRSWYGRHLGLNLDEYGTKFVTREFASKQPAVTQWSIMGESDQNFSGPFMVNYRVHKLEALVAQLKAAGVQPVDAVEDTPYGKFVHVMDPDGNKIELWEPVARREFTPTGKGWNW